MYYSAADTRNASGSEATYIVGWLYTLSYIADYTSMLCVGPFVAKAPPEA